LPWRHATQERFPCCCQGGSRVCVRC